MEQIPKMKVLFLTSKLGYGHTRAADAIEYALMERVPNVQTHHIDLWSLMDERVANAERRLSADDAPVSGLLSKTVRPRRRLVAATEWRRTRGRGHQGIPVDPATEVVSR